MIAGAGAYFERESKMLGLLRKLTENHLIKPIAAYEGGKGESCFLFPWAEGGNLREFWKTVIHNPQPAKDTERLLWTLGQMRGLCGCLEMLHETNLRHGDIKPENILYFLGDENISSHGVLRITDVGLAKCHDKVTTMRQEKSSTDIGTIRYEPPEFNANKARSRRYDVWSLGCVYFEFLIWLLYGNAQLEEFNKSFRQYWENQAGTPKINSQVQMWADCISKSLACDGITLQTAPTALHAVFMLITDNMMDLNCGTRARSSELHRDFTKICEQAESSPSFLCVDSIWTRLEEQGHPIGNQSPMVPVEHTGRSPSRHRHSSRPKQLLGLPEDELFPGTGIPEADAISANEVSALLGCCDL